MGPNHTQVSNTFLDEYMYELTLPAIVVFLAITRKTVGWHKSSDNISQGQLMKMTGISSHETIRSAIDELTDKRLVMEVRHVGHESTFEVGYQGGSDETARGLRPNGEGGSDETATQKKSLKETRIKIDHSLYHVPIGIVRYTNLVSLHGKEVVDNAIQERLDWEAVKGKPPAKDYAAAAANWLNKKEEFNPSPTSHYCQNVRSDDPRRPNHKFVCGLTLQGGKCPECDR